MGRRDKEDPVLTEFVRKRLAQLLADDAPRRARPATSQEQPVAGTRRQPTGVPDRRGDDDPDQPPALGDADALDDLGDLDDDTWPPPRHPAVVRRPPQQPVDDPDDDLDGWVEPSPRRSFSRAHVGVVVGLLLVGLLCAGWGVLRARPVAIASTPVVRATAAATPGSGTSAGTSPGARSGASATPAAEIMVHVLGAVKKPGVVSLPEHSRVSDAIRAAGGLTQGAAPGELNLAQVLADGQQVVIGTEQKPSGEVRDGAAATDQGSADSGAGASGEVNLNSATQSQLEDLPGVGPVTAEKILAWRQEHGRFSRVEELQEIDGIGPKTFAQIAPHARV